MVEYDTSRTIRLVGMLDRKEMEFVVFLIHALSTAWRKLPSEVYSILSKSGVLKQYIVPSYDVLHTLGKEYLVDDVTDCVQEWGCTI